MLFAVVGIVGHFSKTLALFLLPQIINFLYSLPQLARLVPCPRHRLPRFDAKNGVVRVSECRFERDALSPLAAVVVAALESMRLVDTRDEFDDDVTALQAAADAAKEAAVLTDDSSSPSPSPSSTSSPRRRCSSSKKKKKKKTSTKKSSSSRRKTGFTVMNNLTLLNAVLRCSGGALHEAELTKRVLLLQVAGSLVAFMVRYHLAGVFYDTVE
jgi:hypothetical protein